MHHCCLSKGISKNQKTIICSKLARSKIHYYLCVLDRLAWNFRPVQSSGNFHTCKIVTDLLAPTVAVFSSHRANVPCLSTFRVLPSSLPPKFAQPVSVLLFLLGKVQSHPRSKFAAWYPLPQAVRLCPAASVLESNHAPRLVYLEPHLSPRTAPLLIMVISFFLKEAYRFSMQTSSPVLASKYHRRKLRPFSERSRVDLASTDPGL